MSLRVCAMVLTHDRLPLLQECISALRAQTAPLDEIIVVANDSPADTRAWLDAQPDLCVVHQANVGCGGGIATGLEVGVERGHEWIWCFDDDSCPAPDALAILLTAVRARPDGRIFNSLGVATQDAARFAGGALCIRTDAENYLFGQNIYSTAEASNYADANGMIDAAGGQFYYGTLFHRSVIEKVGVPLAWLFWRGDEVEYSLRIMQAGYHIYSVPASIVKHPLAPISFHSILGRKFPFERLSAVKRYYNIRNSIFIRRTYYADYPFFPYVVRRVGAALFGEFMLDRPRTWRTKWESTGAIVHGMRDGLRLTANSNGIPVQSKHILQ